MALLEGKTQAERRKIILLAVLAGVASLVLLYAFVLSGSKTVKKRTSATATQNNRANASAVGARSSAGVTPEDVRANQPLTPIVYERAGYGDVKIGRNIFAYYVAPAPRDGAASAVAVGSPVTTETPAETPTPAPPLVLAGAAPASVYARTGDFAMQLSGDKFTPETRVYLNGSEVPTQFVNPQALRAQVPASAIAYEGGRSIVVRTPDNSLFSNPLSLNVMPPPAPPYTYVGLIRKRSNDTAVLKERGGELRSVQRNDVVGGRFRVTAISERQIELTDTELQIKHTLAFEGARTAPGSFENRVSAQRPVPQPENSDVIDEDN